MVFRSEILIKSDNVIGDVTLFDFMTGAQAGTHVRAGIKFITMGLFGDIKYSSESVASPRATPEYKCASWRRQLHHGRIAASAGPLCREAGQRAGEGVLQPRGRLATLRAPGKAVSLSAKPPMGTLWEHGS